MTAARRALRSTGIPVLLSGMAIAALTLGAGPGHAAKPAACYTKAEFEAEQAIRLHSEMMVVGLKCHKLFEAKRPFHIYADFTSRNSKAIADFEKVLVAHLRKRGEANPTRAFDRLRTIIANDYARQSNMTATKAFCESKLDWLAQMSAMDTKAFRQHVVTVRTEGLTLTPLCAALETQTAARPVQAAAVPAAAPIAGPAAAPAVAATRLPEAKPVRRAAK